MQADPSGEPVDLGEGWTVPSRITVRDDHGGYAVELTAEYHPESGQYETDRVTVGRRHLEVTGEALRLIPVADLLRRGVWAMFLAEPQRHFASPEPRELVEQGPTDETLKWVARWYRQALMLGDAPTRHVAETLGVPRSTAGRWVTRARDRGYLTVQDPRGGRRV